jgi:hypothetical protein
MVAPKLISMTGGRRHKEVDGCDQDVDFDTFCEATQNMLCHIKVVEGEKPSDPDTLDYVFEHVESIVCKRDADEDDDPNPINIDNSFIEDDLEPEPDIPRIIETFNASSFDNSTGGTSSLESSEAPEMPAPVVRKGAAYEKDMLDYMFEKVESLICQEDAPDDHYIRKYCTTAETAKVSRLIAIPSFVRKEQTRTLHKLERERISGDETVAEVLHDDDDGVEVEDKTSTKKKKSNKKPWYKKLAFVSGKS